MTPLRCAFGLALLLGSSLSPVCRAADSTPTTLPVVQASVEQLRQSAMAGFDLTAEQAHDLELHVRQDPQDMPGRARLLGYYFSPRWLRG